MPMLILDNVDDPSLLQPPQADLLSGRKWLHVLATTRLDPDRIGFNNQQYCHVPVDELPEADAVRLIESYQPQGQFPDELQRAAAHEIVRLLAEFTLAVEVVAVHLGERRGRLACTALLDRLCQEGIDAVARQTTTAVAHTEKLLSVTLTPTLDTLSAVELRALLVVALLPSDCVPLPWVRTVVAQLYPELADDAESGYDDPWLTLVNHLIGLRFLQVIEWTDGDCMPQICRIHRLVQAAVRQRVAGDSPVIAAELMDLAQARALFLEEGWLDWSNRYPDALESVNNLAGLLMRIGDYVGAEPLFRRALEGLLEISASCGRPHPNSRALIDSYTKCLTRLGRSRADIRNGLEMMTGRFGMSLGGDETEHA